MAKRKKAHRRVGAQKGTTRKSSQPVEPSLPSHWIVRTYAGFGDAETSNARYRENLAKGQRGLSIAFDLPTQNGYDADDVMAQGEAGVTGVAVSHLGDMDLLFKGIDLSEINTSMTINSTAPWLFALYLALAKKRGIAWEKLRGTTQNDLLKEIVARGTYVFQPETSLKLSTDLIVFAAEHAPKWNPINCCGYHYMESGASAAEEVGFAFGNALMILDRIRIDLSVEKFSDVVKRISFFINSGLELVQEICKVRAYGELWSELCEEQYGIKDVKFRAGCQVRSLTLTEEQPEVNIVRIAYEALPVVLSASCRVGALQLPGFREAKSLPDQAEQTLSLRTQQVLMYETDIAQYGDIFAGSKVVDELTAKIKGEAKALAFRMRQSGYEASIDGISKALTRGLVRMRKEWEAGEKIIVGVNAFFEPVNLVPEAAKTKAVNEAAVKRHVSRLKAWKRSRHQKEVEKALQELKQAAQKKANIMPASIALAEAGGTTGEWTKALEEALGERYQAPLGFEQTDLIDLNLPKAKTPMRILVGKCGLDGHINAVKILAYALSRAGLEVVFTGIKNTPAQIVRAAIQEDVAAIGVSSLAGAHLHIAKEILAGLKKNKLQHLPVVMGGIISPEDKKKLIKMGIRQVFTPQSGKISIVVASMIHEAERFLAKKRT